MLGVIQYSLLTVFWLPIIGAGLYAAGLIIYRLLLSPLARFPGPKLAALTRKYESYYEAVQNYEYVWKIKSMHERYGEQLRRRRQCSIVGSMTPSLIECQSNTAAHI
jgi:hypothetical protein